MDSYRLLVSTCVLCLLVTGCSTGPGKVNYRGDSFTPTLEVPPDLISRSSSRNLTLPGSKVGSEENKGRYVATGAQKVASRVLPKFDQIGLEGQGDLHWLTVPQSAQDVYPLMQNFWADQGFNLIMDEPLLGVMKTEWLSQKTTGEESFFTSIIASMKASDSKDQYVTRIERASEDGKTRIYLAHRRQEYIFQKGGLFKSNNNEAQALGWQLMPADPDKEYAMLSRIMVSLGMHIEDVKEELEKIGQFSSLAKLEYDEDANDRAVLIVKQSFSQTYNRLVHQMDRLSIPVVKQERSKNEGEVLLDSKTIQALINEDLTDGSDEKLDPIILSLKGSASTNETSISVNNRDGLALNSEKSTKILQFLYSELR